MKKTWFFISSLIIGVSVYINFAWATPTSLVKALQLPSKFGSIKETFEPVIQDKGNTIIYLQDAHCNYEAQKNMAQLLDYLVKGYNLKLILVEGGSGNVSLSFLRDYADKKSKEEVADKYLKEGKISGEEYLDITSDYNLDLYGVEDEALYDSHMASFLKIDSLKKDGLAFLGNLFNTVKQLKPLMYSEELMLLEKKNNDYDNKSITLAEYCQHLNSTAQKKGIVVAAYPHLSTFLDTARLEKELNFQQAEAQRNAYIKDLGARLDERGAQNLILMTQGFKAKMIGAGEYYSFLRTTGEGKLDMLKKYPQLDAYIRYITASEEVDAAELLKEAGALEEKIKDALAFTPDQKRLADIDKSLQILTKVFNLELTPEDYAYFKENKSRFSAANWQEFLAQKCSNYNLSFKASSGDIIDTNIEELDNFYKLGAAREQAFIRNLSAKMEESGQKFAVLITGGFHTPGVTRMLKEKSYSYAVIAPLITQKTDSDTYFSVLRGGKNSTSEALGR